MMREGRWVPGTMIPEHVEPSEQPPAAAAPKVTDYVRGLFAGQMMILEQLAAEDPDRVRETVDLLLKHVRRQASEHGVEL